MYKKENINLIKLQNPKFTEAGESFVHALPLYSHQIRVSNFIDDELLVLRVNLYGTLSCKLINQLPATN